MGRNEARSAAGSAVFVVPCGGLARGGVRGGGGDQLGRGDLEDVAERGEDGQGQPFRGAGDQPVDLGGGQRDAAFGEQRHQVGGGEQPALAIISRSRHR